MYEAWAAFGAAKHDGESAIGIAQQIENTAVGRGARAGSFGITNAPDYGLVIVDGRERQRQADGISEEARARAGGGVAEDHHAYNAGENSRRNSAHELAALLRFGAAFDANAQHRR